MLIEKRIKRKIEYEKTDREDKDESRLKEREIRSFQSKGKNNFVSWEISKAKQTSKKENLIAAKKTIIHVLYETQAIQVRTRASYKTRECLKGSSSEQEHKVNALASGADEGRDKLR